MEPNNSFINESLYSKLSEMKTLKDCSPELKKICLAHDQAFSFESFSAKLLDEAFLDKKLSTFFDIKPKISSYISSKSLNPSIFMHNLWNFYLPFCLNLIETHKNLKRPLIQGILGVQGAGKTTFAEITTLILTELGLKVAPLSIDDVYKSYKDREILRAKDPRLKWRGPPGTHDIDVAYNLLKRIKESSKGPFNFPAFDKALFGGEGDRVAEIQRESVDIVLFEGWFVGMRPVHSEIIEKRNDLFKTQEEIQFAKDMNEALKEYLKLWELLDDLIVLWPEKLEMSKTWRVQAEEKMNQGEAKGKSSEEIKEFVEYFWKALNPELFFGEMISKKNLTFRFVFDLEHRLSRIENYRCE